MDFQELLNDYIELFSCTAKELADASGLTAVDISRYRTGNRLECGQAGSPGAL